ncbi:MAG: hypothetical protein RBT46_05155 [Weeksellaceae bacterium]|jgi:hypothetical protein|nr:hypothetical protein [Weeksellaceae bacterium]
MKRFKGLLVFLFFFGFCLAQEEMILNTEAVEKKTKLYNHQFEQREFPPEFKNKYKGKKFDYDREVKPGKPLFQTDFKIPSAYFSITAYLILGTILILVIYFILKNVGGFSFGNGKRKSGIKVEKSVIEDGENIENNNFSVLVEQAKTEGDYRKAVRYYYLWILQKLTENQQLKWSKNKTNYDYFLELDQKPIQSDFSVSNYLYDYSWYGNFQLNSAEFQNAESVFQNTLNKIR